MKDLEGNEFVNSYGVKGMEERNVYILLTDTGTLFTRVIKLFTKKPLNHASIAFDHQLNVVYSFGRKEPSNPFKGGFVAEDIHCQLFQEADCAVYSFSISEQQYQQMKVKINEIEKQKDEYKYNLLGLFAVPFNVKLDREKAYFCSQFVASILCETDLKDQINKPASLVTPQDIMELSSLQLIYQGKLAEYLGTKVIETRKEKTIIQKTLELLARRKIGLNNSYYN